MTPLGQLEWAYMAAKRINFQSHNLTILARVAADQTVFATCNLAFFLSTMSVLEGSDPKEKLAKNYLPGLKANWALWPAVQAVNFKLVPLEHRVLVVNVDDSSYGICEQSPPATLEKETI
ncbi:hypothetical protein AYO21_03581 [Fonsecaea monophora]|uniref:Uncharacterized protein n=1 Tax=Fonsecaea monophora TaxID=254056 RepID=A0A177FD21_9EURO|nr:hypothetical protein AYO21_03581 [Fonsecaea monophora]OAG42127.1 hypothetical protein AYO21_03581 [Fonsecaea monophora]